MTTQTPAIRAEHTLGKTVVDVMRHGGGTPLECANISAGLIEARVREAYKVDGPLRVSEPTVIKFANHVCRRINRHWDAYEATIARGRRIDGTNA